MFLERGFVFHAFHHSFASLHKDVLIADLISGSACEVILKLFCGTVGNWQHRERR